jgi:hypothetical protein
LLVRINPLIHFLSFDQPSPLFRQGFKAQARLSAGGVRHSFSDGGQAQDERTKNTQDDRKKNNQFPTARPECSSEQKAEKNISKGANKELV